MYPVVNFYHVRYETITFMVINKILHRIQLMHDVSIQIIIAKPLVAT